LENTPFFDPLRNSYLRVFKPNYWQNHVVNLRRFYSQFVQPGSLVFDCGANIGDYTQAFLYLGAKVIAVEPNPHMVAKLNRIRNKQLTVVPFAMGREPGELPLNISNRSEVSSMSPNWLDVVVQNDGWALRPVWVDSVTVKVSTLDALIERFGMPNFIKIDVEGFEFEVLSGLKSQPQYLSFEYSPASIETALACIRRFPRDAQFNFVIGEPRANEGPVALALSEWVTTDQMNELALSELAKCRTFGDIFVRRVGA
jgi:FkbM family methyltransferase